VLTAVSNRFITTVYVASRSLHHDVYIALNLSNSDVDSINYVISYNVSIVVFRVQTILEIKQLIGIIIE